jgi:hypothetical protein
VDALLEVMHALATLIGSSRREDFCALYSGAVELCEGAYRGGP